MLAMHTEPLVLYNVYKSVNPEGFLSKNDIDFEMFPEIINKIVHVENYYSTSIDKAIQKLVKQTFGWYEFDLQILLLLEKGIHTKDLPYYMNLSLSSIEKSNLPAKYKAWCYQFGLLPRVSWQLTVYDVPLSPVEQMERKKSSRLRKWLGVPRSLATNALYANSFKLCLPFKSLVEEYKAC
mgnify:CR=1 FL=1